jgi:hypothetical protein
MLSVIIHQRGRKSKKVQSVWNCEVGISIYVVHTIPPFYACGPIDKQCVFCYNVPS